MIIRLAKVLYEKRFYILIISQVIFFILYIAFLKSFLNTILFNSKSGIDIFFYTNILNSLPEALIIAFILSLFFVYCRKRIFNFLMKIEEKRLLYSLLIFFLVCQVFILLFIKTIPFSDSQIYVEHSERLYVTGSFLNQYGHKTAFFPVGLPIVLLLFKIIFDEMILYAKIFNILISVISMYVIYRVFKLILNEREIKIFLFSFFLFPNNFFMVNPILTEQYFTLLLWLFIYFSLKNHKHNAIINGILLGLMLYFRSYTFLIFIFLILYFFREKEFLKNLKKIGLTFIVMMIVASPWIIRNYLVFDAFVPMTTNGGFNFLMGNHKNSSGSINFNFKYNYENPNEVEESNLAYKRGIIDLINNPLKSVALIPLKLFHTYKRGDIYLTYSFKKTRNYISPLLMSLIFTLTNLFFYFVIFVGILKTILRKSFRYKERFLFFILISFLLVCVIYVGNERYLVPFLPFHFYLFSIEVK